jgi:hypothetical protein
VTNSPEPNLPASPLSDIAWNDRSLFEAGLITAEQGVLEALPGASVYHLDMELTEDMQHLAGLETVRYTNQEEVPLSEVYFRLFPNLAGGETVISDVTVNGDPVEPTYELEESAMRVPFATPLAPGEQAVIQMKFAVQIPTSEGGNYGTFAYLDDILALAHFYPMIAVYDDEGWNIEIAPDIGDVIYADSSFYVVRITAPAAQTIVTSGVEVAREEQAEQQVLTIAAGPARDFYLAASERYALVSQTVGETTINSFAPPEMSAGAELALQQAVDAIESFNQRFGVYPYTEFDMLPISTQALGIEYPGVVAILISLYNPRGQVAGVPTPLMLEATIAHEVAHQWFYGLVGNDQIDEPWLDEALAQYATLVYYQDVYGPDGATGFHDSLEGRWNRVNRADIPIGLPVRDYSPQEYGAIVYGRGPLFLEALSERMGTDVFETFLSDYYLTFQWGIATSQDFQALAEQHCECDLTDLFEEWVYE